MSIRLPKFRTGTVLKNPDNKRRYEVHECIGGGGFGRVYRALAGTPIRGEVCVKATLDLDAWSAELHWLKVFRGERRVVALLDHFVLRRRGRTIYVLVLEYAAEGCLFDYVAKEGPVSERAAVRETAALLETLDKLHLIQGLHRDLTPMNILVFPPFQLRFSDFGIARQSLDGNRQPAAWTCNPDWAASEVRRRGRADKSSDLYQMGMLLYYMLTGDDNPPRDRDKLRRTLREAQASPGVARVVRKAISRRPADRYRSARRMLRVLYQLRTQGGEAGPAGASSNGGGSVRLPMRIYGLQDDDLVHEGVLYKTGEVRLLVPSLKRRYASLSAAAKRAVGHPTNGWSYWHYFDQALQMHLPIKEIKDLVLTGIITQV